MLPPTKSCPRLWGKWHEVPKGIRLKTAECRELFPLSFAYAQQLPRFTVEPLGAVQTRRTVPYPFAERSFQWVYGGCGGPKGRNRNLPWPPLQKGYIVTHSYLFTSTPQAIAKPSPGWNKVALLTAVRNSPCSCPFSVSLHPPLAALNSEPRPGSLFIANQKLSPRAGKVARSAERGAAKNSRMPRVIPPQLR